MHRSTVITKLRNSGCVFAEDEAHVLISTSKTLAELTQMVDRRVAGVPLEYVLGWVDFCGLRIAIESGVFAPRRRTEFLVQHAIASSRPKAPVIVDLCCGSGAIGLAVASAFAEAALYAVDIELRAVRCAAHNVGARGQVFQGDLYGPLPPDIMGQVDILVVNAPYVPTDKIAMLPREARLYEPLAALDGGHDGLAVQGRVVAEARMWLASGGTVLIETSQRQSEKTADLCSTHGLIPRVVRSEELDATVVIGTKPVSSP
jgi:release factor glutamine methyltransferase